MTRYLIGLVAVIAVAAGVYLLVPTAPTEAPPDAPAEPVAEPEAAPEPATEPEPAAPALEGDARLEEMAASLRESLPRDAGGDLTFSDAVFLPRMRMMEHVFVADRSTPPSGADLRRRVETAAPQLCQDHRALFEEGVTLRHSFRDRNGSLIQRVHLLPEACPPAQ